MSKNYLIVGGSSGIGLALTKSLVQSHNVWVASRNKESIQGIPNVRHIPFDAETDTSIELDTEQLDGLAYCPGTINLKPFNRLKNEDFQKDFQVNVLGAVNAIQSVLTLLKKAENASIVLFSTVAVDQGMAYHASVAASKGAIQGLTKSLAAEFAPKIRVNCIAPSIVDTPLASRLLGNDEKKEASAKRHPLQKVGTSDDIAQMAAFLIGENSQWTTGQILGVDGGMSSVRML